MSSTGSPLLFPLQCISPTNMLIFLIRSFQVILQIYRFSWKFARSVKMQIYWVSWESVRSYEINLHLCLSRIVVCQESTGSPICRILITQRWFIYTYPNSLPSLGYLPGRWIKAFPLAASNLEESKVGKKVLQGNKEHGETTDTHQKLMAWMCRHIYKRITAPIS